MRRRTKRATLGAVVAMLLLAACGIAEEPPEIREIEIEEVLADPATFDGQLVRFRAAYVGSFEQSVLAGALAESYPPQPAEPTIWVDGEPEGACLISDVGVTWGEVVAEGRFRYEEEGGLGHLGVYTMQLLDARLACP